MYLYRWEYFAAHQLRRYPVREHLAKVVDDLRLSLLDPYVVGLAGCYRLVPVHQFIVLGTLDIRIKRVEGIASPSLLLIAGLVDQAQGIFNFLLSSAEYLH